MSAVALWLHGPALISSALAARLHNSIGISDEIAAATKHGKLSV
jgi:hypothetical protein